MARLTRLRPATVTAAAAGAAVVVVALLATALVIGMLTDPEDGGGDRRGPDVARDPGGTAGSPTAPPSSGSDDPQRRHPHPRRAKAVDRAWVTSPTDPGRRLQRVRPASPTSGPTSATVTVDPDDRRQRWWGTGASLTDSSVRLLHDHPRARRLLFGHGGARLDLVRLPLSATDFSPRAWTWHWDGTRATPTKPARRAVRLLRQEIEPLAPGVRVLATPWSAPASMKDGGSVRGGGLAPEATAEHGRMLVSQAAWLQAHHVPLWAMTLGNEPGYSTDYASMTMTDEQLAELGRTVGPALGRRGVQLFAVDHNWADRPRADAALAGAPGGFDAVAFHCYSGGPDQMAGMTVPRLVTECTGTTDGWPGTFAWDSRNLVSGAVAAGSSGLLMWNLALDADHGPVDPGSRWGCRTCRGLVTVEHGGRPDGGDRVRPEPELLVLAHLARAASPGARVIGSDASPGLQVAAFRNPDGSIGVVAHNASAQAQTVRVEVAGDPGPAPSYVVGAGELFTLRKAR